MNQIDTKQFLAALSNPDKAVFYQDIVDLKTRIWERVTLTPDYSKLEA